MRTKIVYCIVSNDKDIYLEQAWVSIYTLRLYNPDAEVVLLVDKGTEATLTGKRAGIRELVTEVVAVDTPDGYNAMQRSRYLKTNFRQIIAGDLLFIDSDTVIGGSLAAIDDIEAEIACVPDAHEALDSYSQLGELNIKIEEIFGIDVCDATYYFNSGVIYVKDTKRTRDFFVDWYNQWKYSAFEKGCSFDQPALFAADKKNGYLIKELPGEYNCQLFLSLQYLHKGLILHFFNEKTSPRTQGFSPFYTDEIYQRVKDCGGIIGDVKCILDDSSKWINTPSFFVSREQLYFIASPVGKQLFESYLSNAALYRFLNMLNKLQWKCIAMRNIFGKK